MLTSGEGKSLAVRGTSKDAPPTRLPARIREIVTENLSEPRDQGRALVVLAQLVTGLGPQAG